MAGVALIRAPSKGRVPGERHGAQIDRRKRAASWREGDAALPVHARHHDSARLSPSIQ